MNKVSLFLWLSFISLLGISHGNALKLYSKVDYFQILELKSSNFSRTLIKNV